MILYPTTLLNSLIISSNFLILSSRFSMYSLTSSENTEIITSSFPIWIPFISFSSLITVARISRAILNNSGESGHPCLFPELRGYAFSFSPCENDVCCRFIIHDFYYVEVGFFCAHFLKSFNHKWVLNFVSKAFSASIEMMIRFLSLNLLMWCITLIDLHILKNPCIPGINPT